MTCLNEKFRVAVSATYYETRVLKWQCMTAVLYPNRGENNKGVSKK